MPAAAAPSICVLLAPGDARLAAAVDAQERRPDARVHLLSDAAESFADWVWVLDGSAVPRPQALGALLAAAARLEPVRSPAALTSRIVNGTGAVARAHAPLATQGRPEVAVEAAGVRVLPVRATTGGSLLVRRWALAFARGEPAVVWTARMLRDGAGFLVPDSVADAGDADGTGPASAARLLLGTALRPRERLRFAVELAERAAGRLRPESDGAGRRAGPARPSRRSGR